MAAIQDKRMDKTINNLLSRQSYLVTQANSFARSFGNLTAFEHKVLDYCSSFAKAEDTSGHTYTTRMVDIIYHLGLNGSGKNCQRVGRASRVLNTKTTTYFRTYKNGMNGILTTSLSDYIEIIEDGRIKFQFSKRVAPFVSELKQNHYLFELSELITMHSKYTPTLLKFWNADSVDRLQKATTRGSITKWQGWFLGTDDDRKPRRWNAGRPRQRILGASLKELEELYPKTIFYPMIEKKGRKVVEYTPDITPVKTTSQV